VFCSDLFFFLSLFFFKLENTSLKEKQVWKKKANLRKTSLKKRIFRKEQARIKNKSEKKTSLEETS